MRVLIVKLSSMGDVVHTFPALTDAARARPEVTFDWAVDAAFEPLARLHPSVHKVHSIPMRQWRDDLLRALRTRPWRAPRAAIADSDYDLVIDAQGLIKSGWVARWAGANIAGFDRSSAREPLVSNLYAHRIPVARAQHAIDRLRTLFAHALGFDVPDNVPDAGLERLRSAGEHVLLLHGTSWATKHWPETAWRRLAEELVEYPLRITWGTTEEARRAERIAAGLAHVELVPRQELSHVLPLVCGARAVIGVDSGLLHLAAATGVPVVGLYGPTDTHLTGPIGTQAEALVSNHACVPCGSRRCALAPEPQGSQPWPPCLAAIAPAAVADRLRACA